MGPNSICGACKEPIDDDTCWCGDLIESHSRFSSEHMAVPMGCICYFQDGQSQQRYERYLDELNAEIEPST